MFFAQRSSPSSHGFLSATSEIGMRSWRAPEISRGRVLEDPNKFVDGSDSKLKDWDPRANQKAELYGILYSEEDI